MGAELELVLIGAGWGWVGLGGAEWSGGRTWLWVCSGRGGCFCFLQYTLGLI